MVAGLKILKILGSKGCHIEVRNHELLRLLPALLRYASVRRRAKPKALQLSRGCLRKFAVELDLMRPFETPQASADKRLQFVRQRCGWINWGYEGRAVVAAGRPIRFSDLRWGAGYG